MKVDKCWRRLMQMQADKGQWSSTKNDEGQQRPTKVYKGQQDYPETIWRQPRDKNKNKIGKTNPIPIKLITTIVQRDSQ